MSNQIITSELLTEDPGLIDLIDKFISRLPGMVVAIMKAHEDEDWENFTGLIHQMKGVGGNYGYPKLSDICFNIEGLVRGKKYAEVKNQLNDFNVMHKSILAGSDENHKIVKT